VLFYKELFLITFDERSAKLLGVPIKFTNFMFMTLTAITISISSRVAGVLIVSAMMVIPVACALLLASSYFQAVMLAVCFALVFNVSGIFLSFHFNIKPSGAIVLTSIVMFFIIIFLKEVFKRYEFWRKKNKTEKSYNESLRG
jgi:zinc transport system permease protein